MTPVTLLANGVGPTFPVAGGGPEGTRSPTFTWSLTGSARGAAQVGAALTVAFDAAFSRPVCGATVAGNATTAECGAPSDAFAAPGALLFWRVCATGNDDAATVTCASSTLTPAPQPRHWEAPWVRPPRGAPFSLSRPARLRAVLAAPGAPVARATLFAASPAYYKLSLNGAAVSDHFFGSATEFNRRVLCDGWDVTTLVQRAGPGGALALGARLGPGMWGHYAAVFGGGDLPFRAQLHLELENGGRAVLGVNASWLAAADTVTFSDWYKGEVVDGRLAAAFAGWDTPGYAPPPALWAPAAVGTPASLARAELTAQDFPRIGEVATLAPAALTEPLPGVWVFSFAQNFAGVVELTVPSPASAAGATVGLYGGELLFPNGTVWNQLITGTNETVAWTLAGDGGVEVVGPTWVFWGLQHVQVTGWPAGAQAPTLGALVGRALSTARVQTGSLVFAGVAPSGAIAAARSARGAPPPLLPFPLRAAAAAAAERAAAAAERAAGAPATLDAETLAGVQHATVWGARSNWFSIPSDCPTREKRGWMGDGAASAATYARNFDLRGALKSWARSMRDNQELTAERLPAELDGSVGFIVPNVDGPQKTTDAAWLWAVAEVPTQVASFFGDASAVADALPPLARLLAFFQRAVNASEGLMTSQALFGDWCAAFNRTIYQPNTKEICATATHLTLLSTASAWAAGEGNASAAAAFAGARAAFAPPFRAKFALANESGGTWVDALEQAPPVLALALGPDVAGPRTAAWLLTDIETTHALHQTTGSVATRFLYPLLSALGRTDLAAALAAQSSFPSPGYWLAQGATTCWEDYSGVADGQHPPPPTHNHPFLCSHGAWLYDVLLGLRQPDGCVPPACGGYARVLLAPPLLADLPAMAGALDAGRGRTALAWGWSGAPAASAARVNVSLPANTRGAVRVPVPGLGAAADVAEGGRPVWAARAFVPGVPGVDAAALAPDGTYIEFQVGAGDFAFAVDAAARAPHGARACAPAPPASAGPALACPPRARVHFVARAGYVGGARAAAAFEATSAGMGPGGAASRRFAVAHAVEAACRGAEACNAGRAEGLPAPNTEALGGEVPHLCVEWACAEY